MVVRVESGGGGVSVGEGVVGVFLCLLWGHVGGFVVGVVAGLVGVGVGEGVAGFSRGLCGWRARYGAHDGVKEDLG